MLFSPRFLQNWIYRLKLKLYSVRWGLNLVFEKLFLTSLIFLVTVTVCSCMFVSRKMRERIFFSSESADNIEQSAFT